MLEAYASKDILGHYVEKLEEFRIAIGAEDKKKIKIG